jgi:putative oxidoreductase
VSPVRSFKGETTGSESNLMAIGIDDLIILLARLFLVALFLIFGWRKLKDYPGTVSQIAQDGAPLPRLAAGISILMELPVALAIAVGALTRLSAALFVLYTLGASLIEHRYWTKSGADRLAAIEAFYKNLCIMGGFLLLYITGPGKFSVDAFCGMVAP